MRLENAYEPGGSGCVNPMPFGSNMRHPRRCLESGSLPAGPICPRLSMAASSNGTGSPFGLSSEWATLAVCEKSTASDTATNRRGYTWTDVNDPRAVAIGAGDRTRYEPSHESMGGSEKSKASFSSRSE